MVYNPSGFRFAKPTSPLRAGFWYCTHTGHLPLKPINIPLQRGEEAAYVVAVAHGMVCLYGKGQQAAAVRKEGFAHREYGQSAVPPL